MAISIQEYEAKLTGYTNHINTSSQAISDAERELIIAQTHLDGYKTQKVALEEECMQRTNRPISEIDEVLSQKMQELESTMNEINKAISVSSNVNVMTDAELQEAMQFETEDGM